MEDISIRSGLPENVETLRPVVRNHLLRGLTPRDFRRLRPHLEFVHLRRKTRLGTSGRAVEYAYFVENGFLAFAVQFDDIGMVDFGVVGRDGISSFAAFRPRGISPVDIVVRMEGTTAYRIRADTLRALAERHPTIRAVLEGYVYSFMAQMAFLAISNARHRLHQKLARLILMCADRVDDRQVPFTHTFAARFLGAQRTTVTKALHELEGEQLIRSRRGTVEVLDRDKLEASADGAYSAYLRLGDDRNGRPDNAGSPAAARSA